ncbi:unnamed protein product [Bursaphelenchus okinawaensis]|uniref:Uncharacterized protein n=1 Tax=Bursaphelenchus okinawaensis TaxID=465554 RepID=A0A811LDA1_9BILA|nr:unnamed protein product [Bursaphelenchus okinawaensis]CAG9120560.1 unnamed protein product [Bursaphelenchus okinawaensis]
MELAKKYDLLKLTVQLEFSNRKDEVESQKEFAALCQMAVEKFLGEAGPEYVVDKFFDKKTQTGALIFDAEHLNHIWAALTLQGSYLDSRISIQMKKIESVQQMFQEL